MASDNLKRVGLIFDAEGQVDFRKSLTSVSESLKENRNEFKLIKSQWDENTEASEKLRVTQEYLSKQYEDSSSKVRILKTELIELENAENKDELAIQKKRNALLSAQTSMSNYKNSLEDVNKKVKAGTADLEAFAKEIGETGNKAKEIGGNLTQKVTAPIMAVGAAALASVEGTKEFREDLGKLKTNAEIAGVGVGVTETALKNLNAITGESDSNVEALSNLLSTGFKDDQIVQMVDSLSGAVIKFPDTMKIESLADSIQETLATGKATGQYAELLDRLGVGADNFSTQLESCSTETEKQELVMKTLADSGLSKVNEKYRENNKSLIENSDAQYELNEELSKLGEILEPIMASITRITASVIGWFNQLDGSTKIIIASILGLVAIIGPLIVAFGLIASGISSMITLYASFASTSAIAGAGATLFGGSLTALLAPIAAIIGVIGLLVGAFVDLWNSNEQFRISVESTIASIQEIFQALWDNVLFPIFTIIKETVIDVWENGIKPLWDNWVSFVGDITIKMLSLWESVQPIVLWFIETFGPTLVTIFEYVSSAFSNVVNTILNVAGALLSNIGGIVGGIINVFKGIIDFIVGIFTGDWSRAWAGVQGIFKGIFDGLVGIVTAPLNLVIGLINGMIGGVETGVNFIIGCLNKLSFEVPDWVPGIGGEKFGFDFGKISLGRISYLAKGGNLLSGAAVVGEAGPELLTQKGNRTTVSPLSRGGGADPVELIDYDKLVNAYIKVMKNMKIVLNDEEIGKFVDERLYKVVV